MVKIFNPKPVTGRPTPSLDELEKKVDDTIITMTMMIMQVADGMDAGASEEPPMPPMP